MALGRLVGRLAWLLYPLSLLAIAGLGWTKLEQPLGRDQLIHHWMALRLLDGAVPYRDAWEVKPPALYLLHAAAMRFIDAAPRGIHLLELGWQLVFAAVMMLALRRCFHVRWLAAVAPLACLGPYYAFVRPYAQTQAEILVGLPLFVAAWAALAAVAGGCHRRLLAALGAGVAAGVATTFKHVLAPLPVAFILLAAAFAVSDGRRAAGKPRPAALATVAALTVPFAVGVMLVWAAVAVWIHRAGGGEALLWTLFVWPFEVIAAADPAPVRRLGESGAVFAAMLAPYLVILVVAAPAVFRPGEPRWTVMLWAWLVVGAGVILGQRVGWLTYHFLLLFPPVGLLALRAIDRIAFDLGRRGRLTSAEEGGLAAVAVAVVLAGLAYPVGETARSLHQAFVVDGHDGEGYRRAVFPEYARPAEVADYLRRAGRPGAVYAIESLAVPILAGRPVGQPVPGQWLVLLPLPDRWRQVPEDLDRHRPPYIFVESVMAPLLDRRYPALTVMLAEAYTVVFASDYGRLYELRLAAEPPFRAGGPPPGDGAGAAANARLTSRREG